MIDDAALAALRARVHARESGAATWAGFKRQVRLERRDAGQRERPLDEETEDEIEYAEIVARAAAK